MTRNLRPDLDKLELYTPQGPARDLSGESKAPEEVAEVVGQNEQGEADLVGGEVLPGEPGPGEGVFPFLDPLLAFATTVVEVDYVRGLSPQVGYDESDPRE